jgi:hypothetical protein
MTTPNGNEHPNVRGDRWQISLADLIVLVLAVGVAAGVVHEAREVVGNRAVAGRSLAPGAPAAAGSWPVPLERTAGVVFEVAAVFLIVVLTRTIVNLLHAVRRGEEHQKAGVAWRVVWRVAAIGFLLCFIADQSSVLRIDLERETQITSARPWWGANYRLRQGLLPICGALAIAGLALGMGAGAVFDEPLPRRRRPVWLFVPLAGLIGVLLMVESDYSLIAYLVVVAVEAVSNAMHHASHPGPGLSARLLSAGADAIVACVFCVSLAMILASDFERARRAEPWATTRVGRALRIVLLLATAGVGTYLTVVSIPRIQPALAEGLFQVLKPGALCWITGGVGVFALGLAARSISPRRSRRQPAAFIWLSRLFRYGLMAILLLSALKQLPESMQMPPGIPPSVGRAIDVIGQVQAQAWSLLPYPVVVALTYGLEPDQLRWLIALAFVSPLVIELVVHRIAGQEAPFDVAFCTPRSVMQLTWLTVALVVVCLVALPTLVVAGQAGLHIRINLADWMRQSTL